MRAEHMKRWLAAARKAEKYVTTTAGAEMTDNKGTTAFQTSTEPTEAANWDRLVYLLHTAFQEVTLA